MMDSVTPATTPTRLHLKKDERLEIDWADGRRCVYPVTYLRSMCPCAQCRTVRQGEAWSHAQAPARAAKPSSPARAPAQAPSTSSSAVPGAAQGPGQGQPARKKPVLTILPGN